MTNTLLLVSAVVPALLLLWFLCSRDANPEPPIMVLKTFALGALITVPIVPVALLLERLGAGAMGTWSRALVAGFLGAAIPEEGFKFLVLRGWVWHQPDFDEPMDGIVYGAAASLGFAALENALYVSSGGFGVATLRALTAVPGHALTGVVMGYYAGRARFAPDEERAALLATGLLSAMALHGLYDAFLLTGTAWAFAALPVLLVQLRWAQVLVVRAQADQLRASALALPAPLPLPAQPAAPARRRTSWALTKLLLGGAGATASALFLLACALTLRDPAQDDSATRAALGALSLLALGATLGCVAVFRSGLRGPFATAAHSIAPP
jgi:RsiW-degrading membrane proteinase PrsW (M82 family)